ncbi:MAG: outer membrane lipoprotein-sorting protein [Panacagrimonas sp.]
MRSAILAALVALLSLSARAEPNAMALMEDSQRTVEIAGGQFNLTFELISASGGKRVRKVSSVVRTNPETREASRLTRFEYPADARGLASLLIEHTHRDDDLWVYIPAMKKTRRLVADNKRDSFMGTVLSHGDVLGHRPSDWAHEIVGEESIDGRPCWRVSSSPASESERRRSGYSRRESWIDKETAFAWRMDMWDGADKLAKSIISRQVREITRQPGVFVAYEIEARDLQNGAVTRITVDSFEFVPDMANAMFDPTVLEEDF